MPTITAPTREELESKVADVQMSVVNNKLTVAVITLHSGFLIVGESSVANPAHFDQEIGATTAFQNAIERLAELETYRRTEAAFAEQVGQAAGIVIPEPKAVEVPDAPRIVLPN